MILKTNLLDHQVKAVDKLIRIKIGALYFEMGTGKTRTAIELIFRRLIENKINKILWLCPCSVKTTIERELQKHIDGDLSLFCIKGIESLSSSFRLNKEMLNLVQTNKVFLIVDESNLVKNHYAKRTVNIQRLADSCNYKLILNGTPISKCEKDLYSQWKILDWRILGYKSFWSFAANHLEYDDKGRIRRCLNVDYLVKKIAPYSYQVKKSECLNLPDKSYSTKYFCLTDDQRFHYEYVKDEFLMLVDEYDPTTIYRLFTALQQVVSGNRIISKYDEPITTKLFFDKADDNPRIKKFLEVVDKIDGKIIIWCNFTPEIKSVSEVLVKKYGLDSVVLFYGKISKRNREIGLDNFKNKARFFVANKTCGGYGLNLQFCNYMIYYSNNWDWATRTQSEDRIHRMGQDKNVHIVDIASDSTIDERILKCLNKKEALSDSFKRCIDRMKSKTDLRKWIDGKEIGND
jgi:SNF2 family DNA or RNA helicase